MNPLDGDIIAPAPLFPGMAKLLIVGMLLVAAGWEVFRWILAIITLD